MGGPADKTDERGGEAGGGAGGRAGPAGELLPVVYEQLRRAALQAMGNERVGHTLSATALVNEAYVRLGQGEFAGPAAYYVAATQAMRNILIDHARARAAQKRGGGIGGGTGRKISLENAGEALQLAAEDRVEEILILDEALLRLEERDAQAAAVVRLRFFAGLGVEETAAALNISSATVKRDWRYARALLYDMLKDPSDESGTP